MGTGAVYVTLSSLKDHPGNALTTVEKIFFFLNIALFLLNSSTLLLQLICEFKTVVIALRVCVPDREYVCLQVYPRQARRLITDPVKGIFVPLIASRISIQIPRL